MMGVHQPGRRQKKQNARTERKVSSSNYTQGSSQHEQIHQQGKQGMGNDNPERSKAELWIHKQSDTATRACNVDFWKFRKQKESVMSACNIDF